MRSLQVVAGLDAAHGGPSYSAPRLCQALVALGAQAELHAVGAVAANPLLFAATLHRQDFAAIPVVRALRISGSLRKAALKSARSSDVVHDHGLWLMPNVYAGQAAARAGKPLVVSPRGMLAPEALRFSRGRKRLFWALAQGAAYRAAACWHATSEQEAEDIRAFGISAPIAVIPNGIDLPADGAQAPADGPGGTVLSLGRVHPKKGLDRLVRAWARLAPQRPGWRLRIVGPDEAGHAAELKALALSLQAPAVSIESALYGEAKWTALRSADVFVLATRSENFGLSVAEALAARTPVVCTTGAPWEGLRAQGCGWWIDQGVEPMVDALLAATATPKDGLRAMGARGRAWMQRDFGWDAIARQMLLTYEWLAADAARPSFIHEGAGASAGRRARK